MGRFVGFAVLFVTLWASSLGCGSTVDVRTDTGTNGGSGGSGGAPATTSSAGGSGASGGTTAQSSGGSGGTACVPVDDDNPCTDDLCENDVPVSKPADAGSPCSMGGTLCDGLGSCVECLAPADCAGLDDACQTRTCNQGTCGKTFAAAGTTLPVQIAGDCKQAVCDGDGGAIQANDNGDVPDDQNACTGDVCTAGAPSNPNEAPGTACGNALVCDAAGVCVGCNVPGDCPGSDDECQTRTCMSGTCGVAFTASGTAVAAQTPGDCLAAVCDGSGNVAAMADGTDLPPDDGNACTDGVCNAGVPSHAAKANGSACNDGDACTKTDSCVGSPGTELEFAL